MPLTPHIIQLTVADAAVTPTGPHAAGTAGDECATRLNLYFTAPALDSRYRLEIVRGDGVYDITEPLTLPGEPELNFDIPSSWTAAGTAAVRLVEFTDDNGVETARRYYPPFFLQFAYRDEGVAGHPTPLYWQALLTRAEEAVQTAETLLGITDDIKATLGVE